MWLLHKMPFPMHVKEILMWDLKFYTLHCVQCLSWWQWYFVHCQCSSLVSITTSFWRGGSGAKLPSTFCTTDLRGKNNQYYLNFVCIAPPDPWIELWCYYMYTSPYININMERGLYGGWKALKVRTPIMAYGSTSYRFSAHKFTV